ncbi:hypothetical protein SAMN05444123_104127 [Rhodopseudomonas pseudopalustris]|uniref:Uncharacterized protein n=1 Tax=Rhodopseudomonas pseudopalustris TaxID=1513892 RepID=A0A1H8RVZ4_9BRAD|nr:hypothetical protein SAMN05444123_104127 [Rhodopseudomonas pseudopalustris]
MFREELCSAQQPAFAGLYLRVSEVKRAAEFGIQQNGQKLLAFLLFINDLHGMA